MDGLRDRTRKKELSKSVAVLEAEKRALSAEVLELKNNGVGTPSGEMERSDKEVKRLEDEFATKRLNFQIKVKGLNDGSTYLVRGLKNCCLINLIWENW